MPALGLGISFSSFAGGSSAPALPTTNLVARYEPSGMVPSSGTMTGWNDSSGLANHITSIPSAPTVRTLAGRQLADFSSGNRLTVPTSISFNAQSLSVYAVIRKPNLTSQILISPGNGTVANLAWTNAPIDIYDGASKVSSIYNGFERHLVGMRNNSTNTRIIRNGEIQTLTVCGAATQTGGLIGVYPPSSLPFIGHIEAMFIYSDALSDADLTSLRTYTQYTYGVGGTDLSRAYIMEGDSITVGFGVSDQSVNCWPAQWEKLHTNPPKWHHRAVTGETLATMLTQAATQVDAVLSQSAQFTTKIAVLLAGSNDVSAGRTSADIITDLQTWHNGRHTAGFDETVAFTVLPSTSFDATKETQRAAVNTWLRSNWATIADTFVDIAADSRLDDATDSTYYQADGVHPNSTGLGVVAELAYAAGI